MRRSHFFKLGAFAFASAFALALGTGCAPSQNQTNSEKPKTEEAEKLKVVASFYPMADFTSQIGGDKVEVTNLVPAGTEPHDWEPKAEDLKLISSSKLFVYNGAGMESWVDKSIKALDTKPEVVEASKGIQLLKGEEEEGMQYDPHVWVAPLNAKIEAKNILDGLKKVDAKNADYYQKNYEAFAKKLDQLDADFKEAFSKSSKKTIVASHEAYGYLCQAYGLTQEGIAGLDPENEPDPKRMKEIADLVKKENIKVIFSEELVSPKVAEAIARETGAQSKQLNPVEGLTDEEIKAGENYLSIMKKNLAELKEALA